MSAGNAVEQNGEHLGGLWRVWKKTWWHSWGVSPSGKAGPVCCGQGGTCGWWDGWRPSWAQWLWNTHSSLLLIWNFQSLYNFDLEHVILAFISRAQVSRSLFKILGPSFCQAAWFDLQFPAFPDLFY